MICITSSTACLVYVIAHHAIAVHGYMYLIRNADSNLWYFDVDEGFDVSGPLLKQEHVICITVESCSLVVWIHRSTVSQQ